MARDDFLKRYIDAGLAFSALTQERAEALVKDLVKAGEVQATQARETAADLLERSRKNSEKLLETVRGEVRDQVTRLGLISHEDLDKLEERVLSLIGTAAAPAKKAAVATKSAARKATKKKAPAKKKAAAKKKAPAKKKAAAKKSTKKA